jgi:hypothetical protein
LGTLLPFLFLADYWMQHPALFVATGLTLALGFGFGFVRLLLRYTTQMRQVRASERVRAPDAFEADDAYVSRRRLFGLPLLHVRYGVPATDAGPARGWIAIGDRAVGGLFAMGAVAIAPISIGAVSVGLISIGSVSIGLLSLGTIAFGGLCLGAIAVGWFGIGGVALAWRAAVAGLGGAHDYAWGGHVVAEHANDLAAGEYLMQHHTEALFQGLFAVTIVVSIFAAAGWAWLQRWRRRRQPSSFRS